MNLFRKKIFPILLLTLLFAALKSILFFVPQSKNFMVYQTQKLSNFTKPSSIKNCYTIDELYGNNSKIEYIEDKIDFKINDKKIQFKKPVILFTNRIYLPVDELINFFDINSYQRVKGIVSFTSHLKNKNTVIKNKVKIDPENNCMYINNQKYSLYGNKLEYNNDLYLSLYTYTKIFNLVTNWEYDKKLITFYHNLEKVEQLAKNANGQKGLIRLEDMMPAQDTMDLAKTRVIIDYLYENNMPFHLSWIPKYINPVKNIKNDLVTNYEIYNLEFMYTIDYILDKNGLIGLHGYTHQYDFGISAADFEFGEGRNETPDEARILINKAIDCAKELNIPITYFEFPHYTATNEQFKVAEEYFDILYENLPNIGNQYQVEHVNNGNRIISYIPTPFFYPEKDDGSDIVSKFKNIDNDTLISFFLHPILEFKSINRVSAKEDYPLYEYLNTSALHNIVNDLSNRNVNFVNILEIK